MKLNREMIYVVMILSCIALSSFLTACGRDDSDLDPAKQIPSPETSETVPDFRGWSRVTGAVDKCFQVDQDNVNCQTEFTAGEKNCPNAIFKFVSIKAGYMYVQTKENVFIRQGQFHQLNFEEKPEIYNITDESAEIYYSVFMCEGQNG